MKTCLFPLLVGLSLSWQANAQDPEPAPSDAPDEGPAEAADDDDDDDDLVITVTSERWEVSPQEVPMSVTVVTGQTIEDAAITHLEDVLRLAPNLDFVGPSSRPRFLLIRGVGDLGTANLATNPSVGVLVDDIDLSGVGMAATMLDVDRVEVLRGPQGTLYGANALGGLLKVETRAPTAEPEGELEIRLGTRNTRVFRAAAGSRLIPGSDVVTFRAAAMLSQTDGFMRNVALGRDDTAGRSELTTRLKLRIQPTTRTRIDLTGAYVDLDNGYDHWSIYNTRDTWSDRPGEDSQRTWMGAMAVQWEGDALRFVSNTSVSSNLQVQAADYDWISADFTPPQGRPPSLAADDYTIDLSANDELRQEVLTQEFRLSSREGAGPWADKVRWLVGAHAYLTRQRRSTELFWSGESLDGTFNASTYRRLSAAAFGQVDITPIDRLTLTAGGRAEGAFQDYSDELGVDEAERRPLFGWKLAARVELAPEASLYVSGAESSKLGGFNLTPDSPVQRFGPETNRSVELGLRTQGRDGSWSANLTGFYIQRVGQQVTEWIQRPGGDSGDIFYYTDNADRAYTVGAEAEVRTTPVSGLEIMGNMGLLDARIAAWTFQSGNDTIDYAGKRHAHAPFLTYAASIRYRHAGTGLFGRVAVTGASKRYLANNNDIEDPGYTVLNLRAGWESRHFGVSFFGRNVLDELYAVAGFGPFFAPNDHVPFDNYYRWGDGAVFGVSVQAAL